MKALALLAALTWAVTALRAEPPLLVRAQNFLVNPSTGPVTHVQVKNQRAGDFTGALKVTFPAGWRVAPSGHTVSLKPGEAKKYAFTIEKGADLASNGYPVRIQVTGNGVNLDLEQRVVCASAPYFKPTIDGNLEEWKDAIPITWSTSGKKTVVRTYWNNKLFSLAVEVEEDRLIGLKGASVASGLDAIQFAIAAADGDKRHEFLAASTDERGTAGKCFVLNEHKLSLAERELKEAKVAIGREGGITRYELSLPMKLLREIRPTPGREFCFSLLVHDPDGTGLRDLGEVMNLWPEHRVPGGWYSWDYVQWKGRVPFFSRIEFGFCSSIH